jgi:hypothetical protein
LQGAARAVGLVEVGVNVEGAFVVCPADLGQAHPARGAVQEPRANRSSNSWTWLLTIVADRLRGRAASVKPPFSTTLTKAVMLAKRSMPLPIIKPQSDSGLSRAVRDS